MGNLGMPGNFFKKSPEYPALPQIWCETYVKYGVKYIEIWCEIYLKYGVKYHMKYVVKYM